MRLVGWIEVDAHIAQSETLLNILDLKAIDEVPEGYQISGRQVTDADAPGRKVVVWNLERVS